MIVRLALRLPTADGVKVTENEHDAPAASVLPQVVVRAKSPAFAPVSATLEIDSAAVPEFVSVTDFAELDEPTSCEPKLRLVDDSVTAAADGGGAGVVPVPDSDNGCGLPAALSRIDRVAVRPPDADGANVTDTVHEAPAASVLGAVGHVVVRAKSAAFVPASAMLLIVSGPVPVFFTVADCDALVVPTSCEANVRLDGVSETAGPAGGGVVLAPVPLSATWCGLPDALSVTLTLAVRVPAAVGVKVVDTAQEAPAASVLGLSGHVVVRAKSPAFAPVSEMPVIVSAALPVFFSVADWAALVDPTVCEANVRVDGVSETAGADAGGGGGGEDEVPARASAQTFPWSLSALEAQMNVPLSPAWAA